MTITVIVGFLHCFSESNGIKSMSNMFTSFTNECIHVSLLTNFRARRHFTNVRAGPGCPPGSLGVVGHRSLFSPGIAGRGSRVDETPRPCQP